MTTIEIYERVQKIIAKMPIGREHDEAFDLLLDLHVDLIASMTDDYEAEHLILELAGHIESDAELN